MKVEHPSMKRTRPVNQPVQQSIPPIEDMSDAEQYIDVSQPTQQTYVQNDYPVIPQQPPAEVKQKWEQNGIEFLNKDILEDLLFVGHSTKEIEIGKVKFEISTLTNRESNQLMRKIYEFGEATDILAVKTLTLAFALRKVNNIPLENVNTNDVFDDPFDKKMFILDNMQKSVVEKLHSEYLNLSDEVDKQLSGEQIKNS